MFETKLLRPDFADREVHPAPNPTATGADACSCRAVRAFQDQLNIAVTRANNDGLSLCVVIAVIVSLAKHLGQTPGFNLLQLEGILRGMKIIDDGGAK